MKETGGLSQPLRSLNRPNKTKQNKTNKNKNKNKNIRAKEEVQIGEARVQSWESTINRRAAVAATGSLLMTPPEAKSSVSQSTRRSQAV